MLDRYTLAPMKKLWGSEATKFQYWLKVELAVLKARVELGDLSQEAYEGIARHAAFDLPRIAELEAEYDHDMIAFIVCVQEYLERAGVGQYKEEFHKGITSYDVEDPAVVLMLREAAKLILEELGKLQEALSQRAREHQWTLMIGRTHGQYAEPTTFGHMLLVFAAAVRRSISRIQEAYERDLGEAKISGAVGNYAGMDLRIEAIALGHLGLRPAVAETQILQRDRHAAFLATLAIAAGTIEQMCRTFWEMMRSDVRELEEPRRTNQRGSSAMAHKKNPILTERLMGMARLVRAYAHAAQENIATPEGRDISQSSVERHIFPDATSLVHYMASRATGLVGRLTVFSDRMQWRLENGTQGVWAGQQVRVALMERGISYDAAYEYVQRTSFEAVARGVSFVEMLSQMPFADGRTAWDIVGEEALKNCFDAISYVRGGISRMFENVRE